jgi:MFS family permease
MVGLTFGAYGTSGLTYSYALLAGAVVFIAIFVGYERRAKYPLIYLRVFRIRQVSGGLFALLFNIITWTAVLLLLSLQFQLVDNLSPLQAGLRILPFEIAFLAVGPLSGRLADKYGQTQFILTGLTISTVALFLFSTTGQATPYFTLSIYMVLLGVGTGLFVAPNLRAVMSSVPVERHGIGSALFTLFLNIGLTVSLNLTVLIMSLTAPYNLITQIISSVNPAAIPAAGRTLFVDSLKNTYFAFAIINAIALIPAIIGGRTKKTEKADELITEIG